MRLSSSSSSRASLVAQLVKKNLPAKQETRFDFWARKIHWRRDKLPTPVSLGFPGGSDGKESTCNAGDLGSIPGLGRSPGEENSYPLQYSAKGKARAELRPARRQARLPHSRSLLLPGREG